MTNHIKKMLRIVEENLEVSSVTQELIKKKQTLVIHANLAHDPKPCTQCGSTPFDYNGKQIVVKNGSKLSRVTLENYHHMPTIIQLKKQK